MELNVIRNKLNSINWDFDFTLNYSNDTLHPINCRKYYSYPATFIPEIPYALIDILSKKGDSVLDPFGGIGTTFMQALVLEREPYSFDINPVACSVCETLYFLFNPLIDKNDVKNNLLKICDEYDENIDYSLAISPSQKELSGWFEKKTFNELSFLIKKCDDITDEIINKTLSLILSSILVTLSSQNKGWAYIADNVKPKLDELKEKNVFEQYKNSVKNLLNDINNYESMLSDNFSTFYNKLSSEPRVINDSFINSALAPNSIDLIITSPPYPKMIDYIKSQRLSFNLKNEQMNCFVEKELGARCKRSRKDSLNFYLESIKKINIKLVEVLKKDAYFCIVLPDYDQQDCRKKVIDTLVENYSDLGLIKIYEVGRYIPSHKRTLSIQWATLVNERIYIFQKG